MDIIEKSYLDLGIQDAWAYTCGEYVKVCILDTGIALHTEFDDRIMAAVDFTGSGYGFVDIVGHGTHVAGVVGAAMDGEGMAGIAPGCELYIGKVLDDAGMGKVEWLIQGLLWARECGCHVVNCSMGGNSPNEKLEAVIRDCVASGMVIVCAAGNEGMDTLSYPAAYEGCIAVVAVDDHKSRALFSNHGVGQVVSAPGVSIWSTHLDGLYKELDGTSMACPFVAGAVALYISAYYQTWGVYPLTSVILEDIRYACDDLGVMGVDREYGYGLLNIGKLVKEVCDYE